MSNDDICGAECVDGSECQNAAGSCPVPSHTDSNADDPQGRDFSISEDDHDDIIEAARMGASKAGCARAAGVSRTELNRYLDEHDGFRSAFRRARAKGEQRLIEDPLFDDPTTEREMDGQHARFLLSTSFDYSEKQEVEHSGRIDGEREHTMDDELTDAVRDTLEERYGYENE